MTDPLVSALRRRTGPNVAGLGSALLLVVVLVPAVARAGRLVGASLETAGVLSAAFLAPAVLAVAFWIERGRGGLALAVAAVAVGLPFAVVGALELPNAFGPSTGGPVVTSSPLSQWYVLLALLVGGLGLVASGAARVIARLRG